MNTLHNIENSLGKLGLEVGVFDELVLLLKTEADHCIRGQTTPHIIEDQWPALSLKLGL